MDGPEHYHRAEQLAAEAYRHLGQENEQAAATWAAVAQVHATLALAAATALKREHDSLAWMGVAKHREDRQSVVTDNVVTDRTKPAPGGMGRQAPARRVPPPSRRIRPSEGMSRNVSSEPPPPPGS